MSDREMLEMAAKAAGIAVKGPVEKYIVQFDERHKGGFIVGNDRGGDSTWNPLGDDGDALRLAVRLKLNVSMDSDFSLTWASNQARGVHEVVKHAGDPIAATRRAIVRAAAEIGKAMP